LLALGLAIGVGEPRLARAQDLPTTGDRANDEADLARPIALYDSGQFAECAKALSELLDPKSTRALQHADVVERARVYYAACLIGSGKADEADAPLRDAIRKNPQMSPPDSLIFPQPVIERFMRVRQTLVGEIDAAEQKRIEQAKAEARAKEDQAAKERARIGELERLATEQTVIVQNRRAIALIPFGVGQFQNGDAALGWVFLSSEVVLGGLVLTSWAVRSNLISETVQTKNADLAAVNGRLQDWQTVLVVSSYALLGVAVAGIAEAQISFVPEFRTTRRRALPKSEARPPTASLRVVPQPGGATLGIVGRF
jgi:hypothetical protein